MGNAITRCRRCLGIGVHEPVGWLPLVRIGLAGALLFDAAGRWRHAVELYATSGDLIPLFPGSYAEPPSLPADVTIALHTLHLAMLACVMLGWQTRISLWSSAALFLWFGLLDAPGTMTKYTVIAAHLFFWMGFTNCGGQASLDAVLLRPPATSAQWPRRMMQLLLCSVYLGAGVTKLQTPDYASGVMLGFALLDPRYGARDAGLWLAEQPALLAIAAVAVVVFELVFPFLIWVRALRVPLVAAAMLLHAAMAVFLAVGVFSAVMLAALLVFLPVRELPSPNAASPRREPRMLWVGRLAWVLGLIGAVITGACLHPYDPAPLPLADGRELADRIAQATPLLPHDYLHRIDLGPRISGPRAVGRPSPLSRGGALYLSIRTIAPHPPLALELRLTNPVGEAAVVPVNIPASQTYRVLPLAFPPEFPAGDYLLQLHTKDASDDAVPIRQWTIEVMAPPDTRSKQHPK